MRVHQPDHTGCNWSAEVDFPREEEDHLPTRLAAAKSIIVVMREQYNMLQ